MNINEKTLKEKNDWIVFYLKIKRTLFVDCKLLFVA